MRLPDGWSQLTGDVLTAGAQGVPVDLSIRDNRVSAAPAQSSSTPWLGVVLGVEKQRAVQADLEQAVGALGQEPSGEQRREPLLAEQIAQA